jgi:hypothetical protein
LDAHTGIVTSVAFSPDSTFMVSASADSTIRIWDSVTGTCRRTISVNNRDTVSTVCVSPCGGYVVSMHIDGAVRIWEVATGDCVRVLVGASAEGYALPMTIMHARDSKQESFANTGCVVAGDAGGGVCIWDANTKWLLRKLKTHNDVVLSMDAHPRLALIAAGGMSRDPSVHVYTAEDTDATLAMQEEVVAEAMNDEAEPSAAAQVAAPAATMTRPVPRFRPRTAVASLSAMYKADASFRVLNGDKVYRGSSLFARMAEEEAQVAAEKPKAATSVSSSSSSSKSKKQKAGSKAKRPADKKKSSSSRRNDPAGVDDESNNDSADTRAKRLALRSKAPGEA